MPPIFGNDCCDFGSWGMSPQELTPDYHYVPFTMLQPRWPAYCFSFSFVLGTPLTRYGRCPLQGQPSNSPPSDRHKVVDTLDWTPPFHDLVILVFFDLGLFLLLSSSRGFLPRCCVPSIFVGCSLAFHHMTAVYASLSL